MDIQAAENGVTSVFLADAVVLFGDRSTGSTDADEARLAAAAALGLAPYAMSAVPVLYAQQIHGNVSYVYGAHDGVPPGPHLVGACDALITAERGVGLVVRTADCLPVAVVGGGVVAMIHAGWRGLAADILGRVVRRIWLEFGIRAEQLEAVVGIGIGPCHYLVGDDVTGALAAMDSTDAAWNRGGSVDLRAFALGRLRALGLPAAAVAGLAGCTYCDERHHSFRRDGAGSGRQWSAAMRFAEDSV